MEDLSRFAKTHRHLREFREQGVCGIADGWDVTNLCTGLTLGQWERRYTYSRAEDAEAALAAWDGTGDPPGPWRKEFPSGRNGPGADEKRERLPASYLRRHRKGEVKRR